MVLLWRAFELYVCVRSEYYTQRASVGLIISEATIISKQAHGWQGAPAIYSPEQVAGWKAVTDSVHAAGGKMICQRACPLCSCRRQLVPPV